MKPGNQWELAHTRCQFQLNTFVQKDERRAVLHLAVLDGQTSSFRKRFFYLKGELCDYLQECVENFYGQF